VRALCGDIVGEAEATASEAHQLVLACSEDAREAHLDPKLFRQLAGNLVMNAIKCAPAGGRVTVMVARHEGAPVLRVGDQIRESGSRPRTRSGSSKRSIVGPTSARYPVPAWD